MIIPTLYMYAAHFFCREASAQVIPHFILPITSLWIIQSYSDSISVLAAHHWLYSLAFQHNAGLSGPLGNSSLYVSVLQTIRKCFHGLGEMSSPKTSLNKYLGSNFDGEENGWFCLTCKLRKWSLSAPEINFSLGPRESGPTQRCDNLIPFYQIFFNSSIPSPLKQLRLDSSIPEESNLQTLKTPTTPYGATPRPDPRLFHDGGA